MDAIYTGAVEYERMKTFAAMGLCIILGICFISSAISSIYSSLTTSKDNSNNDTSSQQSSNYGGPILSCIGCICFLVSFGLYYMATNKSMEKVLAVNGALDSASTISNIFMRRGGYFDIGE